MSIKYKEAKLSTSDFIGGWYMPSDICNKFINFFDLNIDLQVKGISINANKDELSSKTLSQIEISNLFSQDPYFLNLNQLLFENLNRSKILYWIHQFRIYGIEIL